jgi:hypothetical protein
MYISRRDSSTKGFMKWADTDRPHDGKGGRDDGSVAVVHPVPDDAVPTRPQQPHRPCLAPAAGGL